jgi:hypothetical protein
VGRGEGCVGCAQGLESKKWNKVVRRNVLTGISLREFTPQVTTLSPYSIVWRIGPNNRLRDDAATKGATAKVGINGSRGLVLRHGNVGRYGEHWQRREEIHCGVCGVGVGL